MSPTNRQDVSAVVAAIVQTEDPAITWAVRALTDLGCTEAHLPALTGWPTPLIRVTGAEPEHALRVRRVRVEMRIADAYFLVRNWLLRYPHIPVAAIASWRTTIHHIGDPLDDPVPAMVGEWLPLSEHGWLAAAVGLTPHEYEEIRPDEPTLWTLLVFSRPSVARPLLGTNATLQDPAGQRLIVRPSDLI